MSWLARDCHKFNTESPSVPGKLAQLVTLRRSLTLPLSLPHRVGTGRKRESCTVCRGDHEAWASFPCRGWGMGAWKMRSACQLGRDSEDQNHSLGLSLKSLSLKFLIYKIGLTKPTYLHTGVTKRKYETPFRVLTEPGSQVSPPLPASPPWGSLPD